MHIIFTQPAP